MKDAPLSISRGLRNTESGRGGGRPYMGEYKRFFNKFKILPFLVSHLIGPVAKVFCFDQEYFRTFSIVQCPCVPPALGKQGRGILFHFSVSSPSLFFFLVGKRKWWRRLRNGFFCSTSILSKKKRLPAASPQDQYEHISFSHHKDSLFRSQKMFIYQSLGVVLMFSAYTYLKYNIRRRSNW